MPGDDDKFIHVRCSPALKRKIRLAAAAAELNQSDFVRSRLGDIADDELEDVNIEELLDSEEIAEA
ncbi:hypothetical protein SAMN06269185_3307 [Natronoarchaeum philippinense]|uniref:Uncharacterized protein n=1 Tax=Natronoarchaeum philippinense TaxID=558529 RepID=A0A285PDL7_NATPI|nr:hypothetical protein [Natronoarchaeum philippinense]SNZ18246.1 hypothetical protein SAMN06269185_3307 [Natronoarchaeum philippinense]